MTAPRASAIIEVSGEGKITKPINKRLANFPRHDKKERTQSVQTQRTDATEQLGQIKKNTARSKEEETMKYIQNVWQDKRRISRQEVRDGIIACLLMFGFVLLAAWSMHS